MASSLSELEPVVYSADVPAHRELYHVRTIYGITGSGKSWLIRTLAERFVSRGWRAVIRDTPDPRPAPAGVVKVRTLAEAWRVLRGVRYGVYFDGEASDPGVALTDNYDPDLLRRIKVHRHGGPSFYLAAQVPVQLDRNIRKYSEFSYILYMGSAVQLRWIKQTFGDSVFEAARRLEDPRQTHKVKWIIAHETGAQ